MDMGNGTPRQTMNGLVHVVTMDFYGLQMERVVDRVNRGLVTVTTVSWVDLTVSARLRFTKTTL